MTTDAGVTDWGAWSRESVALMQRRNDEWHARFRLTNDPFRWDLETATIRFHRATDHVVASLCLIGTISDVEGTFLWAWANDTIPHSATAGLQEVQRFGEAHRLTLLIEPEFPASRADALEILATAGRILDADGVFIDSAGDVTCFFALKSFRVEPLDSPAEPR